MGANRPKEGGPGIQASGQPARVPEDPAETVGEQSMVEGVGKDQGPTAVERVVQADPLGPQVWIMTRGDGQEASR